MLSGSPIELSAITGSGSDPGLPGGPELIAFSEAVAVGDGERLASSREALSASLGPEAVVEAAAVMAMFHLLDRVADATGIPIDEGPTRELRYAVGGELGMDHLAPEARASR